MPKKGLQTLQDQLKLRRLTNNLLERFTVMIRSKNGELKRKLKYRINKLDRAIQTFNKQTRSNAKPTRPVHQHLDRK
jgi:CII-binding regulator of phage lambda lysogenization HflD